MWDGALQKGRMSDALDLSGGGSVVSATRGLFFTFYTNKGIGARKFGCKMGWIKLD